MVIVGAGFGGVAAVRALCDVPVDVMLIDRNNFHLFQPLLYQVATAVLDPSQVAHPVRAILRGCRNATFRMATVTGVDLDRRLLTTDRGEVEYDRLILAAGSATNYFGIPGLDQRAYAVKELGQALALRARILEIFERADAATDLAERRRLLTFAIVGGGPTGVEFAGALTELIHLVLRKDYPQINVGQVRVILADALDHVLTPFSPRLRRVAQRSLASKGVELRLGASVRDVDREGIVLADGTRLPAATVVWMAGVRAAPVVTGLGDQDSQGRLEVDPTTLRVAGRDDVYAIGDAASVRHDGRPLPMLAPVAIQGGRHVAARIAAEFGAAPVAPFRYRDKGTMATIGRNSAVAEVAGVQLSGLPGWLAWLFVHLILLVGFRSKVMVLVNWAWDYFFYDRPVRLITVENVAHLDD